MAKLGTAFVDIQPDFSSFDRLVARRLAGSFRGAGEQAGRDFSDGFDRRSSGLLAPIGAALNDVTRTATRATEGFKDADTAVVRLGRDGSAAMKATQVAAKAAGQAVENVADKVGAVPQAKLPASAIGALDQTGRIDLQISGAEAELATLQAQIDELTAEPKSAEVDAKIGKAVAKFNALEKQRDKLVTQRNDITVEVDRSVLARLQQDFSDLTLGARVDIQMEAADQELSRLQARLNELAGKPATVKVNAEIAEATTDLLRVQAQKDRLSATRAKIDVDVDRGLAERFNEITTAAGGLVGAIGTAGGGLGGATTRISAGFFSFGASLTPLVAIIATLAIAIGVSLVGALAALGASLAFAAAGVGALAAAIGGVLVPAVGLAVAVGSRLGKVFEALKAQDAAADQVGRSTAAGSAAAAAAVAAQESAARALTDANRQLGEATKAAYREMADAAEAATDAIRGVENAQLSLDQAKLSTEQATLNLEKFRAELGATGDAFAGVFEKFTDVAVDTSGLRQAVAEANDVSGGDLDQSQLLELRQKILDVRAAKLREKDAVDGVSDAMRASTRAQQIDNQFKRQGIAASQGYQAALRGVETATLAVAQAQDQKGLSTAQVTAADLTAKLTDKERELLEAIKAVRTELRGSFQPATDAVFGGMLKALGRIPALINPLRGAFNRLGQAIGDSLDVFSGDLVKPDSIAKIRAFTDAAAKLAGPVTAGISSLLDILSDIAQAALPYLVSGTQKVADQLEKWSVATGNTKSLNKSMKTLMGHLKTWLGVGAAIADVFLAFLPHAAGEGKSLAESIKSVANETAAWLRDDANREKIKKFFKDAIAFAKDFAKFVTELTKFTVEFGQKAAAIFTQVVDKLGGAKTAADTLLFTLGALVAFKFTKGIVNGVRDVHKALTGAHKAATLLHAKMFTTDGAAATSGLVGKAKTALSSIGTALATAGTKIVEAGRAIGRRLITLFGVQGAVAGRAAGTAAAGASGLGSPGSKTKLTAAGRTAGSWVARGIGLGLLAGVAGLATELVGRLNSEIEKEFGKKAGKASETITDFGSPGSTKLRNWLWGKITGRNAGGMVPGYGDRDTVPILATPGEHVTRKAIVRKYGPTVFADINEGRLDPTTGYADGERPSVGTQPVRGRKFAEGGLVGAAAQMQPMAPTFPINVAGGGPPDPVDLAVKTSRIIESRFGGAVRQGID